MVELPPQNEDLSKSTVRPPISRDWFAADMPARPPPTTIVWLAGNTFAIRGTDGAHLKRNWELLDLKAQGLSLYSL